MEEGLKVASYNVKRFEMKEPQTIISLLKREQIDICGLQEVPGKQALSNLLGQQDTYDFVYLGPYFTYGIALIYNKNILQCVTSKLHLLKDGTNKKAALEVTLVYQNQKQLTLIVTHLDHRTEPQRMLEITALLKITASIKTPHIILGDFNALKRTDYTDDEWDKISLVRKESNWELPQLNVIEKMEQTGYVDLLSLYNENIITTSRFCTRVDYIFATKDIESICSEVIVSQLNQSDHKPIMAIIKV